MNGAGPEELLFETQNSKSLQDWSKERLAGFKCPQTFEVVAELPRDPNGKVLKRLLREAHGAGDQ